MNCKKCGKEPERTIVLAGDLYHDDDGNFMQKWNCSSCGELQDSCLIPKKEIKIKKTIK